MMKQARTQAYSQVKNTLAKKRRKSLRYYVIDFPDDMSRYDILYGVVSIGVLYNNM